MSSIRLVIGERKRANLVVQLARFFAIITHGFSVYCVHAGGSALLQKQQRRGRGVCLSVELVTEHDVPPAPRRPARHASCRWGLLSVFTSNMHQQRRGRGVCLSVELGTEHDVLPAPRRPARHASCRWGLLSVFTSNMVKTILI